ncbi:aspartate racemase [Pseudescherichia vulneris]|nr:amino acid racemase [Pseudescherichia vulneris]STQ61709.1 aspartate racemase [Pseudescherichia vulneris]
MKPFLLGVLGGMGPLATVDFMAKLLAATPATRDQQQIPVVGLERSPDCRSAEGAGRAWPVAAASATERHRKAQRRRGKPYCHSLQYGHHWYDALSRASDAPILHIVEATLERVAERAPTRVGVIATHGTLAAGWFQQGLERLNVTPVLPTEQELESWFVPGCYAVKRGALREGGELLSLQAQALVERGAETLILACTEVPVALDAIDSPFLAHAIDPAQALAERCSALWQKYR